MMKQSHSAILAIISALGVAGDLISVRLNIVSAVLMGAFGPTDGIFAKIFTPIFFAFGPSTAGAIYSFGYTLLVGTIFNLIMGVVASKLMLKSVSQLKILRNPWLYGGKK